MNRNLVSRDKAASMFMLTVKNSNLSSNLNINPEVTSVSLDRMPYRLDPRIVLGHLNELGYTHITATQLKEFMLDLKKVIKYDDSLQEEIENLNPQLLRPQRARRRNRVISSRLQSPSPPRSLASYESESIETQTCDCARRDVHEELYQTSTISSKAKSLNTPNKKESCITVKIQQAADKSTQSNLKTRLKPSAANLVDAGVQVTTCQPCRPDSGKSARSDGSEKKICQPCRPDSGKSDCSGKTRTGTVGSKKSAFSLKPKPAVSFIRPKLNVKPPKSDPVALYHQYCQEWKRAKIPGTDNHEQLRWAIREKLMGDNTAPYCF